MGVAGGQQRTRCDASPVDGIARHRYWLVQDFVRQPSNVVCIKPVSCVEAIRRRPHPELAIVWRALHCSLCSNGKPGWVGGWGKRCAWPFLPHKGPIGHPSWAAPRGRLAGGARAHLDPERRLLQQSRLLRERINRTPGTSARTEGCIQLWWPPGAGEHHPQLHPTAPL